MTFLQQLAIFGVICLASYLVGKAFKKARLPSITGYLLTGALAGPFVLEMLPSSATSDLRFVDEVSLAVIAMVAGAELLLRDLKPRRRAIGATVGGIIVFGYFVLAVAIYLLAPVIPFTSDFEAGPRLALALLGAAVLLALSPPSAIAVIKEVQARGRFTRTVLGVTVLMDVAIIVLFALITSLATPLLENASLEISFMGVVLVDLTSALTIGLATGVTISWLLGRPLPLWFKAVGVLALGFGVYELADFVRETSSDLVGFEVYIEPLLISLIAGLYVANYTARRVDFEDLLHKVGPAVYVAFFTITGLSLKLDLLTSVLPVAIGLFLVRVIGIGLGATVGGRFGREPSRHRKYSWMAYITQAGIALGLAREVAVQFPTLGDAFATLIISVVVINEVVGPLFLKSALRKVGEAHEPDLVGNDGRILVFGSGNQPIEVARILNTEGFDVTVVRVDSNHVDSESRDFCTVVGIPVVSDHDLEPVFEDDVIGVVAMLEADEANEAITRFASDEKGVSRLVVRSSSAASNGKAPRDGVLSVHPTTGIVALLAQAVLTPNATSLLLQHDHGREIVQVSVTNPDLDGVNVADLRLPAGVLLMEIRRSNAALLVDGRTRVHLGDELTLIADDEARAEMQLVFSK